MTGKEERRWDKLVKRNYLFSESEGEGDDSESSEHSSDEETRMETSGPSALPSPPSTKSQQSTSLVRKPGIFGLTDKKRPIGSIMTSKDSPPSKKLKPSEDSTYTHKKSSNRTLAGRTLRREVRQYLTVLSTLIDPATSNSNVRWSSDGQSFRIIDEKIFDLPRWCEELHLDVTKRPQKSLKGLFARLKTYFSVEPLNGGYTITPKENIEFTNETYQTSEIVDTGSDIRRKQELSRLTPAEKDDLILDHEQRITERDDKIQELSYKLEEVETIHRVQMQSMEEELKKEIRELRARNEELATAPIQEPNNGTVSSTVPDMESMEDAVQYDTAEKFGFTEKGDRFLRDDLGPLSSLPLSIWPPTLDDWMNTGITPEAPIRINTVSYRDVLVFRRLLLYGYKRRKQLLDIPIPPDFGNSQ